MADLKDLTVRSFEPQIGEHFRLAVADGETREVVLIEARPVGRAELMGASQRIPFSIVFADATNPPVQQGIHTLENESLGRLELFLVPIQPDEAGNRYEAIFS